MAVSKKKVQKKALRFLKRPTVIGFVIIILTLGFEFYSQELYTRKFISKDVRVVDGDTIVLDDIRIRLQGVDAPESKQMCRLKGKEIPCGTYATQQLSKMIGRSVVECTDEGHDKYRRQLSYCYVGDRNLNRKMVRDGYAVAYSYFDITFIFDEWLAKVQKKGLWTGEFENPASWRKKQKKKQGRR